MDDEQPTTWECDTCTMRYRNATSADAKTHRQYCDGKMHSVATIRGDAQRLEKSMAAVADAYKARVEHLQVVMRQAALDLRCQAFDAPAIAETLDRESR